MPMTDADITSAEWIEDSMHWRGKVLTGKRAHWCFDWDMLPCDETTDEITACHCYEESE
jgi:hypothetical protein